MLRQLQGEHKLLKEQGEQVTTAMVLVRMEKTTMEETALLLRPASKEEEGVVDITEVAAVVR